MRLLSTFTGMPSRTRKRKKSPLGIGLLKGPGERDLHGIAVADGGAVDPRIGGLPQNNLHAADVGGHLLRHWEGAGIGIGTRIGPHARKAVAQGHHRVFQHDGHDLQQSVGGKLHVARQQGLASAGG